MLELTTASLTASPYQVLNSKLKKSDVIIHAAALNKYGRGLKIEMMNLESTSSWHCDERKIWTVIMAIDFLPRSHLVLHLRLTVSKCQLLCLGNLVLDH